MVGKGLLKDPNCFVGAHLDVETHDKLALWSIMSGKSKAAIIRDALKIAMMKQPGPTALTRRAVARWNRDKAKYPSFAAYIGELLEEMEKAGVSEGLCTELADRIRKEIS